MRVRLFLTLQKKEGLTAQSADSSHRSSGGRWLILADLDLSVYAQDASYVSQLDFQWVFAEIAQGVRAAMAIHCCKVESTEVLCRPFHSTALYYLRYVRQLPADPPSTRGAELSYFGLKI